MKISIPELSLVVLIGASGSGKSTFAKERFLPTEVISSDFCRGLVTDDENSQSANADAFDVLNYITAKRLQLGRLTVIDATNVQESARKSLVKLARDNHVLPVAIVLDMPENLCLQRNRDRTDRNIPDHVIRNHVMQLKRSLKSLKREGRYIHVLRTPDEISQVEIEREPLWNNLKTEHGPFDIIGDVHGCIDELKALLTNLGYEVTDKGVLPPKGRKAVFLGDLVDRGPGIAEVLKLVMGMVKAGTALCVPGNHDIKLLKKLNGSAVQITHGLDKTLEQLENETPEFIQTVRDFIQGLVSHYVLDDGKLVVAHAGMKEALQGRGSSAVRDFALYGETTGETDEYGLPIRLDWAADYRGRALVVYGHTPQLEAQKLNNTLNIDTGCVFGGKLTAYRYPEKEFVEVKALKTYFEPAKPLLVTNENDRIQREDELILDIDDVTGKRIVTTRLYGNITLQEENSIAALELMSRFAVDPRWLIYLPPTMSPSETSQEPDMLEHPAEAFAYYRTRGVDKVVCEQKHMGSRAVVIACKNAGAAKKGSALPMAEPGCATRVREEAFFRMPPSKKRSLMLSDRLPRIPDSGKISERIGSASIASSCHGRPKRSNC